MLMMRFIFKFSLYKLLIICNLEFSSFVEELFIIKIFDVFSFMYSFVKLFILSSFTKLNAGD